MNRTEQIAAIRRASLALVKTAKTDDGELLAWSRELRDLNSALIRDLDAPAPARFGWCQLHRVDDCKICHRVNA